MRRPEPQLLADIIKEKLMTDGIESQFNEQRVLYLWSEVVGPGAVPVAIVQGVILEILVPITIMLFCSL